jgi:hypothetical protein
MRHITLGEMLTDAELLLAVRLNDRQKIRDQIITPNIDRINKSLGQENDPDYLAYAVAYSLSARRII